ncbi:MdtA/MuxA family multidrug efflux RND transporter periplasmic adaptor subunit [Pragia fontium]|uniref:Membrane fusion protein, multidrug efflux system n=1 Tax=Pragia fontium DSM 5563 = ATCC 49100 TaxID=1122977 RepID=A0AAJ4WBB8_9GAMM|nr:MdtA/MuxA family multidrug efflux RND transporter periplasmic adaptor subunit [Pragia fontium]SFC98053.1 membrane fusion protein, multidrug efflux system [Pragia fontium DSM 5563 = ATCC 49100]
MVFELKRLLRPLPLITIAVIAVGGAILYYHYSSTDNGKPQTSVNNGRRNMPQPPVQVATALQQEIPRYLSGLGTVTAANTVTVRNRVDGQIMAIHFNEGQEVKAGDLLVEIDPRPFQVQLTQAEGQLANMQATLSNAKRDLSRYQKLIRTNMVSQQQLDTQIALVKQTEGSLKAAQGAVDSANLQLTYSKVTAPISGRVGLKLADVGNYVTSGDSTGLVVITQTHPIDVVFNLPETTISNILPAYHSGTPLTVEAWDRENKRLITRGNLLSMDNQIDPTTGTIKLKARFSNDDNMLFPNQFVNTQIKVDTIKNAVVVPTAAIQTGNNENFVWLVDQQNKVSKQPVIVGFRSGELTVIDKGIETGQRVITDGVDRLKQGVQVEVVTPESLKTSKPANLRQQQAATK